MEADALAIFGTSVLFVQILKGVFHCTSAVIVTVPETGLSCCDEN